MTDYLVAKCKHRNNCYNYEIGDCNCIAKQEMPFDSFICNNGEMFEEVEE